MPVSRISAAFEKAKSEQRTALVTYIMAGDPDMETSYQAMNALVENGADLIELGAPFTDPMADGPSIQRAGQRSLKAGTKLRDVLALAKRFRETNQTTPVILMGYANPIHHMGYEAFAAAAADAGLDGSILVDLPPEEDQPVRDAYAPHELAVIRLATPTTQAERMKAVAHGASGFLYYVSVTGVTGAKRAVVSEIEPGVKLAQDTSGLPVCVGFGIKTGEQAREMSAISDGVVVGSAFIDIISGMQQGKSRADVIESIGQLTRELSAGLNRNGETA
ncbi:tryptophan synthase subunit alpha [Ponticaulis sp.]|uniref:tryptophan synthase subunit alpha n=1 Tax=Ponticaulis sp. TaxID=2020902 RepID=UPI000B63C06A|nr:tryptophan synthase subunit alpha [Ponticaulis sp.]MAI91645.1 tryptophan synthase subunit alpha [Ponticaulis sp.]OUX97211.1 MAG: tryptophan synthase subunit alpha [Hyphomonadaceae bacterium TMED5]|tara:strand:- start:40922 stop:41752 length:831 start_codon:yes stop_codon:yes gene_type:complete